MPAGVNMSAVMYQLMGQIQRPGPRKKKAKLVFVDEHPGPLPDDSRAPAGKSEPRLGKRRPCLRTKVLPVPINSVADLVDMYSGNEALEQHIDLKVRPLEEHGYAWPCVFSDRCK